MSQTQTLDSMRRVRQVTDEDLAEILMAERAVLILTKSTCGSCGAYQAEIERLLERGKLAGVPIGKLVLDQRGATRFKRENPWVAGLTALPYTVIYRHGMHVDGFSASKGSYLLERLEDADTDQVGLGLW